MLKKIVLIPLVATSVVAVGVIVPAVIFAPKNQTNNSTSTPNTGAGTNTGTDTIEYFETKENISATNASSLGLPQTREELKTYINDPVLGKSWVVNKKDSLLVGTTSLLTSSNQVNNIIAVDMPNSDLVVLLFELKEGSYIDGLQQVATAPKTFKFQISIS